MSWSKPSVAEAVRLLEDWERLSELGAWEYVPEFARKLFDETEAKTTRLLDAALGKKGKRKRVEVRG